MDDKQGVVILAILGALKLILEILKLILEILEKQKTHPKRQQPAKRKRKG
ncbi:hypothetical protein MAMMFC1_01712 [Methylomusa anaerophila]|uniref:Uncharacterized protein n=1 Tax=Methylomusa anaerophila TaxID=1930071 RepID=A0A348AIZ6_9FIRM|nr:hypothetical protein MAMMFC1_01712 [Methylomusa anaerophila]